MDRATRKCPHCAEEIRAEAVTCRFCDRDTTVRLSFHATLEPKELHDLAIRIMGFKPGLFSYRQLRQTLAQPEGILAERLNYQSAQELIGHLGTNSPLHLHLDETPPLPSPEQTSLGHRISGLWWWLAGAAGLAAALLYYFLPVPSTPIQPTPKPPSTPPAQTQLTPPSPTPNARNITTDLEKLIAATVLITDGNRVGSGFVVREDGYILTNAHVIEPMRNPRVQSEDGKSYPASVLGMQKKLDLSLIKIEAHDLPTLPLGDATSLRRGDAVWTIGSPRGLSFSVTKGIISYVGRKIGPYAYLQSDVAINPGNSGGPMIDRSGRVVGVNTFMITRSQGLNFAVPINYAYMGSNSILEQVRGYTVENEIMKGWREDESGDPPHLSSSTQPEGSSNHQSSALLRSILEASKRLDQKFNAKSNRLNRELAKLRIQNSALRNRYYGRHGSPLSISEEAALGRRFRDSSLRVVRKEINLLQQSVAYYDKKLRLMKSISDPAVSSQLQVVVNQVETKRRAAKRSMGEKRAQLKQIMEKTY